MRRPLPTALDRTLPRAPEGNLGLWLDRFLPRDPVSWALTGDPRRDALEPFAKPWTSAAAAEALERRASGLKF